MSPRTKKPEHPRSYDADAKRLKVTHQRDLGMHPIPLTRIIGSAGKPDQVDADFKPLLGGWAQHRYSGLLNAAKRGATFQPISVYKLHDLYYIIDGHNRVAAAKDLGQLWIDAYVTESLPKAEGKDNLLYYERKHFEEQTGLTRIILTKLWRYPRLLEVIRSYAQLAATQLQRETDLLEASRLWYRDVYHPMAGRIRRSHLPKLLKGRTTGDIFFDILQYQVEASHERDRSITLDEAFLGFEARHPAPMAQRMVRKGLEAVAAPLTLPARLLEESDEEDQATAELESIL
ncbi:MAG TPA: ParB N-terminal domain-containing protein [Chloroflexota bacterium]|nr:ParB N-terminal domain-containing protein [Chloroflexota bacterium]